jgi:hypothetical protein
MASVNQKVHVFCRKLESGRNGRQLGGALRVELIERHLGNFKPDGAATPIIEAAGARLR